MTSVCSLSSILVFDTYVCESILPVALIVTRRVFLKWNYVLPKGMPSSILQIICLVGRYLSYHAGYTVTHCGSRVSGCAFHSDALSAFCSCVHEFQNDLLEVIGMPNSNGQDLATRMKQYERAFEYVLPRRIPVIIRIDGRAFQALTRKLFGKKWAMEFVERMIETASKVMKGMQGCDFCYSQSDEISFLLTDYRTIKTEAWFGYDVRKLISISASLVGSVFSRLSGVDACFDSRCFCLPEDEVCNYFIWRQRDATRNAILAAGREHFSHKQLHLKNGTDIQEMLLQQHGINFEDYSVVKKRGFCICNGSADLNIPVFSKDRDYVERFVYVRED